MQTQVKISFMDNGNLALDVPLAIRIRRGRKVIIAPETVNGANPEANSPVQSALFRALAQSHAWLEALENEDIGSIAQLARKLNLDNSYVGRILRLVNLAPDIQEAIVEGSEPDGLSLNRLCQSIPADWEKQMEQLFGVPENFNSKTPCSSTNNNEP